MENRFDLVVIGGGIVGLATAYKIQSRHPSLDIAVLEKEERLALHQSGRNSGVLHSGLYYKPGSYKAKHCVEGRRQLVAFAERHRIPHEICGKLVVAVTRREADALPALLERGNRNGLAGVELIDPDGIREREPSVVGLSALHVPETGIIDFPAVVNKLAEEVVRLNPRSRIVTGCRLRSIRSGNDWNLETTRGEYRAGFLVACAGLQSDRIARMAGLRPEVRIVGFRGDYFDLPHPPVKNLVYPVPDPDLPFLGVHLTRMIDGSVECGPSAVMALKREGYGKLDIDPADALDALGWPGTWRLFRRRFRFGLHEYARAFSKRLFLGSLRKLVPSLEMEDLVPGKSGIRACALRRNGELVDDFVFEESERAIHVLNAPSPAATACLAIGDAIAERAEGRIG